MLQNAGLSPDLISRLSSIQQLYNSRARNFGIRESTRFSYLGPWISTLRTSIAKNIQYFDSHDKQTGALFSIFYQNLKRDIPACTLNGRPLYQKDGSLAFANPAMPLGPWQLGGDNGVSFLGPLDAWFKPFSGSGPASALRLNETLIRSGNVSAIQNQFLGSWQSNVNSVGNYWSNSTQTSTQDLMTVLGTGQSLYNFAIVTTISALQSQLQVEDATSALRDSIGANA